MDYELVLDLARRAGVRLSSEEARSYAGQLGDVLAQFQQLDRLDLDGVEPLTGPIKLADLLRRDAVREGFAPGEALRGAPDRRGDSFRVPRVLEEGR